jgi:crotonobetaine/carnitine-CoA ligase
VRLMGHEIELATIGEVVEARAALGTKAFLTIEGETLTYRDADLRSNRYAHALASFGVSKGDVVTTFLYNSIDHVCIWFACAKLGAIWAPLNVSLHQTDLGYAVAQTAPKVFITEDALTEGYLPIRDAARPPCEILVGDHAVASSLGMHHVDVLNEGDDEPLPHVVGPEDPCGIVYTGGSTGLPKGALVPHLYYIAVALRYREIAQATPADVMYECGHLFHSGGQGLGVLGPLYSEMSCVMHRWFSVSRVWDLINEHRANIVHVPGPMLGPILDRTPPAGGPDHEIRLALGIGTGQVRRSVRDAFEQRFGFPLLEVYAQSEMGVLICSERVGEQRQGSSGHAYGWAQLAIVDELDQELPPGHVGEIVTRPTHPYTFMLGYYGTPEVTNATWRNLWHHTGDLGYLDDDGYLFFTGRRAYWIRRRGENISSFEVEKVLSEHPAVEDCGVVGVPSELGDEDVKAYVLLRDGQSAREAELVEWCAANIAYFKVPRYVELVDELPRTASKGDVDRTLLKQLGVGAAWDRETDTEPGTAAP